jgi:hypothetical protein
MASTSGHSSASADSFWAAAAVLDVDAASSPPTPGKCIVLMWFAKAAASGMQRAAAKNSDVPNVGANVEHMAMAAHGRTPITTTWQDTHHHHKTHGPLCIVCSTCSKAQVESCFLSAAIPMRLSFILQIRMLAW